ncbi:MAG: FKBP-type peptidyl-prolyl cis-trans isomerase [Porphyromonadaceae bacterium]|nr:FKBP-type peptidyl-prolyl cis-trans isomerase [Porphyromonadaceae bacterium]
MKYLNLFMASAIALSLMSFTAKPKKQKPIKLATQADSAAYALGILNGTGFKGSLSNIPGDSLSHDIILRGFNEAFKGDKTLISPEEAQQLFMNYYQDTSKKVSDAYKIENEAYLENYKKQEGVKTTASGLAYKVLRASEGPRPTVQDTVVVHYEGRTIDGKVFDSSYERKEPTTFGLLQVIPGWTEGLCLMNKGSKYELVIPSNLAYGERGASSMIKPNSTLIFDIELLDIKPYVEKEAPTVITNKETQAPDSSKKAKKAKKSTKKK